MASGSHLESVATHRPTSILSIGSFDGVHYGHQSLISAARSLAATIASNSPGAAVPQVIALAFDPHPRTVLAPTVPGSESVAPARLSTFSQRERWLKQDGADAVELLTPTTELLGLEPEDFIAQLVERFNPVGIVEGPDFAFGKRRRGNLELLAALGQRHGFAVHVQPPAEVAMSDGTMTTASSTMCRWLITHGGIRDAAALLGRPYQITGTVVRGDRRGRTIGFPTANLDSPHLMPADGVYAAVATLPDGRRYGAAVNVGPRPTFPGAPRTVEPHLIGVTPGPGSTIDGLSEYGWMLTLDFIALLRKQVKFESLDALKARLAADVVAASASVTLK